jgi:threonine/homoserine/homoserine lactone efflux protein
MIESWLFVLAMIAVLMIPGPTNALLASSAHQQGIAKTSLLIPAEFFGYMYAISL